METVLCTGPHHRHKPSEMNALAVQSRDSKSAALTELKEYSISEYMYSSFAKLIGKQMQELQTSGSNGIKYTGI